MNIVVVMHSHALGGAERHVLSLMTGLRERDHRVHFAGPLDSWLGRQLQSRHITGIDLAMRGMYDPWSAWRLARYLQEVRADLIHGHSMRGTRYAVWAGKQAGIPVISSAHSTTPGRWLHGADHILPVSQAVRSSLAAHGYGRSLHAPIHLGVSDPGLPEPAQRLQQRRELGLDAEDIALVMLGRLVPDKGHDLALAALSQLPDLPLKLFIIGDHSTPYGQQMQALVVQLGLAQRVRFMGQREHADRLLGSFDCLLQPSRREALSLSLLEASAQSLAIIASDVGGIPEIVRHQQTGLLVPIDDSPALASAIRRLADAPALRLTLGSRARQQFCARFTTERMMAQIEAVYRSAAEQSKRCQLSDYSAQS